MRHTARLAFVLALTGAAAVAACHSAPPPAPPVVVPLSAQAAAAVQYVQAHATPFAPADSLPGADERARLEAFVGDARVIGISELTEGTREFPRAVGHLLFSLASPTGVRALVIQGPMAEAAEVDRYVRTGVGDEKRLLHQLDSWRWETPEMRSLVSSIRAWNVAHPDRVVGFAGFEIPTAAHAVNVVNSMPDSLAGTSLKGWFRREYGCVLRDESARFGREGRAADSTFWRQCGTVVTAAVDSIVALRQRSTPAHAAALAHVEEMARLVQHHVTVGLRYLSREEANAEHVMYVANALGPDARILVWGGDVEMGRITLDKTTVQTAVPLGERLGERFRNLAFVVGTGTVRAKPGSFTRSGQPAGLTTVTLAPPTPASYEDVLNRTSAAAFWLDMRQLPADSAGHWLAGPRSARLITEQYLASQAEAYETPLVFPKEFDGLVFIKRVSATR